MQTLFLWEEILFIQMWTYRGGYSQILYEDVYQCALHQSYIKTFSPALPLPQTGIMLKSLLNHSHENIIVNIYELLTLVMINFSH